MLEFKAEMSVADNCVCSACRKVGRVIKLELPETRYYDGKNLSTKYRNYWLCIECKEKLSGVLIEFADSKPAEIDQFKEVEADAGD